MIPASASSSNKAAAKKAIQVEDDNSPRRETRERRLWNEMLPSVPVGTELIKDFGPLGLFKGRVEDACDQLVQQALEGHPSADQGQVPI